MNDRFFFFVFPWPQELRKVENLFIINLAIADLCVTAYVDPLSIVGKWFSWIQ